MEIDLSQFQIRRLEVKVVPWFDGTVKIMPVMYVPAVGDSYSYSHGQEIDLSWNEPISAETWENWNKKEKAEFIVKMTMNLLEHEVREQLGVDGERVLYPHPGVPVPPLYEQYKPTRKEMQAPVSEFKYLFDFGSRFTEDNFLLKPKSEDSFILHPKGMTSAAPQKPPRSRYSKPHGGFPSKDLVRPKSRQESRHASGVR